MACPRLYINIESITLEKHLFSLPPKGAECGAGRRRGGEGEAKSNHDENKESLRQAQLPLSSKAVQVYVALSIHGYLLVLSE